MHASDTGSAMAGAMLIEWFRVLGDEDEQGIVESIERDRPDYSMRPGLIRKLLPIVHSPDSTTVLSGGSYLFETLDDARAYLHWTEHEHRVDGVLFRDRPFVADLRGFLAPVVGVQDFAPIGESHAAQRIQVWHCGRDADVTAIARRLWPGILSRATQAGVSSIWLGADADTRCIGLVTVAPKTEKCTGHDYAVLDALRGRMCLANDDDELRALETVVDECMWVFTIWLPPRNGRIREGLWPNSPPLPSPAGRARLTEVSEPVMQFGGRS